LNHTRIPLWRRTSQSRAARDPTPDFDVRGAPGLAGPPRPAYKTLINSLTDSDMGINSDDIVPMNQVRASFTDLAEQVRGGREKIITRNGESYVALVDARRLDHYHRLEREHIHLALIDEATRGIADIDAGRTMSVAEARARYKSSPKRRR
jgi:hypothetical protein